MPVCRKRKETDLTTACLNFLQCHVNNGNIRHRDRLNSGNAFVGGGKRGRRIKLCQAGTPDLFFVMNDGIVVWVETKMESGRMSDEQKQFRDWVKLTPNHRYVVAYSTDDIVNEFDIFKFK